MAQSTFAFLLAPGAGASSDHPRMKEFACLLAPLGEVVTFDYPYMLAGRKRPDPLPKLVAAHREALVGVADRRRGPVVLVGKSMGGRVGCHLALEVPVAGVICLGYPLSGAGDPAKLRDQVLTELRTPILFVQGTRDKLCPLDLLETTREKMSAPSRLHVVSGGDHSLLVSQTGLKAQGRSQAEVDAEIGTAIADFLLGPSSEA